MKFRAFFSGIVTLMLVLILGIGASMAQQPPEQQQGHEQRPPENLKPGDRLEDIGGVAVIVPHPGQEVWAEAILGDGSMQELMVETLAGGTVQVSEWGDDSAEAEGGPASEPGTSGGGGTGECQDDASNTHSWTWSSTYNWKFNSSSTPAEITVDNAEEALRAATQNITGVNNICGFADNVSATANYQGRFNETVQITDQSVCGSGNGSSATSFGDLASNHLAYFCVWQNPMEGDLKLNKVEYQWVVYPGADCSNKWVVEAAATHERGHIFGIDHVSEDLHPNLTMSRKINGPCQNSEATLGKGDKLGLESKY